MIGLENNLLQKDEKEAALIEEIQELSNKIPENESLLNSLNEQLSSPEIADFRVSNYSFDIIVIVVGCEEKRVAFCNR